MVAVSLLTTMRKYGLRGLLLLIRHYAYRVRGVLTGPGVTCPVCDWQGKQFRPYLLQPLWVRTAAACPNCGALERHRALYLFYSQLFSGNGYLRKNCVFFAPEECLEPLFRRSFATYIASDYEGPGLGDMQAMPYSDTSIDVIVSHHVIEHVQDDQKAFSEIRRVLKPDGVCYVSVPVDWDGVTREFGEPDPRQNDHCRTYGADIMSRFSGFRCRRISFDTLCDATRLARFGIIPGDSFFELKKQDSSSAPTSPGGTGLDASP
jgi:SAM-dependent methyltransferase